jgi:ABC-2 type transport system permease protein
MVMVTPSLVLQSLRERRRALIGWIVGLVLFVAFTVAFYPSVRDSSELDRFYEDMPEGMKAFVGEQSLTSPEGYLESQLFLFLVPLLFMIFAVGRSADAIAGEERRGTLDLLLANPLSRGSVVIQKFVAACLGVAILGAVVLVTMWVTSPLVDLDVGAAGLAATCLGAVLLSIQFGAMALAVGAGTGKKGLAIGVASAVATAAYFLYSLAPIADAVEPYRKLSTFYYYLGNNPLKNGFEVVNVVVLAAIAMALVVIAVFAFDRRDVAV